MSIFPEIPAPPPSEDFSVYKGASFHHAVRPLDVNGNPYDLTGVDVKIQIINPLDAVTAVLEMSTSNGKISIANPPTLGQFTINLTPADTGLLSSGGAYDVQIHLADGTIYPPVLQGKFILLRPLTH